MTKLYDELKTKIGRKRIAHATSVHWGEEMAAVNDPGGRGPRSEDQREVLCVKFHETDIVKLYPDGRVRLDSGGWRTPVTRSRIEEYSGIHIRSHEGIWFVYKDGKTHLTPFYDGMLFDRRRAVVHPRKEDADAVMRRKHALDRAVSRYIKAFIDDLMRQVKENGHFDSPNGGDCWDCSLFGDHGVGHLLSHLAEDYFVPSLLLNATRESCGGTSWQSGKPNEAEVTKMAGNRWSYSESDCANGRPPWLLQNALRRYFSKRKWRILESFDPKAFKEMRKEHLAGKEHAA